MELQDSPTTPQLRPAAVARDVAILWVLTLVGGFVAGVAGAGPGTPRFVAALFVSNTLLGIIGFIISGCLVGGRRWKHLFVVALILWLTGLVNMLSGVTFIQWVFGIVAILIFMGIGGGISYLFRK